MFKIPCPSCGTTRAIEALLNGNFFQAFYCNPLGFILLPVMLTVPFWVIYDMIFKQITFYNFYIYIEKQLKKPSLYVPSILLILILWAWNIYKMI
jgi:hypothetical protein